ncbi:hypothetical protein CEXT_176011 [Caerostris extrusa]|uniref:Uncharacterized protein n=1 Tax=Caerostris extrusa TaxID=172846 RepID=A0AAV4NLJ3_CAEEX|nr:hypothetical protein CEXT_176011 [Caerostris extrusa]
MKEEHCSIPVEVQITITILKTKLSAVKIPTCNVKTEFSCRGNPPLCIALSRVRDGSPDCPDGSDEGQCINLFYLSFIRFPKLVRPVLTLILGKTSIFHH